MYVDVGLQQINFEGQLKQTHSLCVFVTVFVFAYSLYGLLCS